MYGLTRFNVHKNHTTIKNLDILSSLEVPSIKNREASRSTTSTNFKILPFISQYLHLHDPRDETRDIDLHIQQALALIIFITTFLVS